MVAAAGVLVGSTAIGAIIGAFAGGVGAAPGAALGFEIGSWLLEWLGLGFLAVWGAQKSLQIYAALGQFVSQVWKANGNQKQLQQAGAALADALAILSVTALQVLVTIGLAKGVGAAIKGVANSQFGKAIGIPKLTAYISQKIATIKSTAASHPKTASTQELLNKTNPKAVFTPSSTQQSTQPNNSNGVAGNIRPVSTGPIIPMEGINTHTYSAPINMQKAYLSNPYWKSMPDYAIAADNLAIQSVRANFKALGIDLAHLSDAEILAIRQYTTQAYVPLNSGLRSRGDVAELAAYAGQSDTRRLSYPAPNNGLSGTPLRGGRAAAIMKG